MRLFFILLYLKNKSKNYHRRVLRSIRKDLLLLIYIGFLLKVPGRFICRFQLSSELSFLFFSCLLSFFSCNLHMIAISWNFVFILYFIKLQREIRSKMNLQIVPALHQRSNQKLVSMRPLEKKINEFCLIRTQLCI